MHDARTRTAQDHLADLRHETRDLPPAAQTEVLRVVAAQLGADDAGSVAARPWSAHDVAAIARAARAGGTAPAERWLTWVGALSASTGVLGYAGLGAVLALTAHFEADADWSVHPVLALLAFGAATLLCLLGITTVWLDRRRPVAHRAHLTAWVAVMAAVALGAETVTAALPVGAGWWTSAAVLLLGALAAVDLVRVALLRR